MELRHSRRFSTLPHSRQRIRHGLQIPATSSALELCSNGTCRRVLQHRGYLLRSKLIIQSWQIYAMHASSYPCLMQVIVNRNYAIADNGGHQTQRARWRRLLPKTSTSIAGKCDYNPRNSSRQEEHFLAFPTLFREACAFEEHCSAG